MLPIMPDSEDLLKQLLEIDSPTLSNAIERLKVRDRISGFAGRKLRHLTPELGILCGYAVTAHAVTMAPEPGDRARDVDVYIDLCSELGRLPGPGVVVIQEVGPQPAFSTHCGEVMATMFRKFGAVGLISDSAVRDLAQVRELGFHLFAPGAVVSHGNFRLIRTQTSVTICGLQVEPGDLLHGDENGLLKVPKEGREKLPGIAAEIMAREKKILDYLGQEEVSLEELQKRMTL
jgi:regulator of RNase E activity RraA